MKQQLAFLKTVENKLKGALGNSKTFSGSGEKFNAAVTFALPAIDDSRLTDGALWALGEPVRYTRPDGELDEEDFDELDDLRETELLKTRIMTPEAQREWASSAPEMKEVQFMAVKFVIIGCRFSCRERVGAIVPSPPSKSLGYLRLFSHPKWYVVHLIIGVLLSLL